MAPARARSIQVLTCWETPVVVERQGENGHSVGASAARTASAVASASRADLDVGALRRGVDDPTRCGCCPSVGRQRVLAEMTGDDRRVRANCRELSDHEIGERAARRAVALDAGVDAEQRHGVSPDC